MTCLKVDVRVLQLVLPPQRTLHRPKLRALRDAALGEDPADEPVNVEHQGQAGTSSRQDRPVGDRVQGTMLQTH